MSPVVPANIHQERPQAVPRSANRGAWVAWLYRRSTIEPHELFVAMLMAATPDWRQWPLVSLESINIARRIGVDVRDIERIAGRLAAQGFLRDLQEIDTLGRHRFLAILPPVLPGERQQW